MSGVVLVWERDGLWEARLARELEPDVTVRGCRSGRDLQEKQVHRNQVLILVDAAARDWVELPLARRSAFAAVLLIADSADDPAWLTAGVSATFDATTSAGLVAEAVRQVLASGQTAEHFR